MIKINLISKREEKPREVGRQITLGVILIFVCMAALGYLYWSASVERAQLKRTKVQRERQLARLKKEVGDLQELKRKKEALERKEKAIKQINKNRLAVVKVLDALSMVKPAALFFTQLKQKNNGDPWDDFTLSVRGIATDNEVIAQFMRNLQKLEMVKEVDLDYTKAKKVSKEAGTFQEFRINIGISFVPKKPK
jgi:type IV pilus assembly protein PilN